MTAVEWLASNLGIVWEEKLIDLVEQAKQLEKQEIIDAFDEGKSDGYKTARDWDEMVIFSNSDQYYNETYGSKESDETSSKTTSDKWKEYQDWLNEVPEISDEEIEKGAKEWYNKEGAYSASAIALKTWVYAIRWYREQLKQRQ